VDPAWGPLQNCEVTVTGLSVTAKGTTTKEPTLRKMTDDMGYADFILNQNDDYSISTAKCNGFKNRTLKRLHTPLVTYSDPSKPHSPSIQYVQLQLELASLPVTVY
jgi:hypothetical protein